MDMVRDFKYEEKTIDLSPSSEDIINCLKHWKAEGVKDSDFNGECLELAITNADRIDSLTSKETFEIIKKSLN